MCLLMLQIDELLSLGVNVTVYNGQVMIAQLLSSFLVCTPQCLVLYIQINSVFPSSTKFSNIFLHPDQLDVICSVIGAEAWVEKLK